MRLRRPAVPWAYQFRGAPIPVDRRGPEFCRVFVKNGVSIREISVKLQFFRPRRVLPMSDARCVPAPAGLMNPRQAQFASPRQLWEDLRDRLKDWTEPAMRGGAAPPWGSAGIQVRRVCGENGRERL